MHLGGVGGEHRRHQRTVEERDQACSIGHAAVEHRLQRVRQAALARGRARHQVRARAPDVVLVLGDVGQVREVAEGAHDLDRLVARQRIEDVLELAPGRNVVVAAKAHRVLADLFDAVEGRIALLLAHGVAQDTPEQADVLAQWVVLGQQGVSVHRVLQ